MKNKIYSLNTINDYDEFIEANCPDDYYDCKEEMSPIFWNKIFPDKLDELQVKIDELTDDNWVLVDGSCGTWTGNHGYTVQCAGSFDDFRDKMSSDIDNIDVEFYQEGDQYYIEVRGYHHDGTNLYVFMDYKSFLYTEQAINIITDEWSIDDLKNEIITYEINNFIKYCFEHCVHDIKNIEYFSLDDCMIDDVFEALRDFDLGMFEDILDECICKEN